MPYPVDEGEDHLCEDCIESASSFTMARAAGKYETVFMDVIHRFKYQGKIFIGEALGKFMAGLDYTGLEISDRTLIIPIPLHRKRLRERGFNQSVILAREISRHYAVPMKFGLLKRKIHTEPQINLGKDDRVRNVKGAFEVVSPEVIEGAKILLIDDVYTTGSTVNECAKVLRKNGAADVVVLTLARAV
jgi:ComF family protein